MASSSRAFAKYVIASCEPFALYARIARSDASIAASVRYIVTPSQIVNAGACRVVARLRERGRQIVHRRASRSPTSRSAAGDSTPMRARAPRACGPASPVIDLEHLRARRARAGAARGSRSPRRAATTWRPPPSTNARTASSITRVRTCMYEDPRAACPGIARDDRAAPTARDRAGARARERTRRRTGRRRARTRAAAAGPMPRAAATYAAVRLGVSSRIYVASSLCEPCRAAARRCW